jgi:L,D-transpeptidase catalytic domain
MRRALVFFLILPLSAVGFWFVRSRSLPAEPAPSVSAPQPNPFPPGLRTVLTRHEQREAAATGGFEELPRSLLRIDQPMRYGDSRWNDVGIPAGPVTVRVDLRTQILSAFRAGHEIGTAVILYGADVKETPLGRFPILWKGKNHRSSTYDAPMPFTLRLTGDGVSIHGSDVRWGAATHGCIGIPTEFAEQLYDAAKVGDSVTIVRSASPAAKR